MRSTTPPPHHRGEGGQYHTPTTPQGGEGDTTTPPPHHRGEGTVLWLTHDHGRGGGGLERWTIDIYIYICICDGNRFDPQGLDARCCNTVGSCWRAQYLHLVICLSSPLPSFCIPCASGWSSWRCLCRDLSVPLDLLDFHQPPPSPSSITSSFPKQSPTT